MQEVQRGWISIGFAQSTGEGEHADVAEEETVHQAMEGGGVELEGVAEGDGDGGGVDGVVEPLQGAGPGGAAGGEGPRAGAVLDEVVNGVPQGEVQWPGAVQAAAVGVLCAAQEGDGGTQGGEDAAADVGGMNSAAGASPSPSVTRMRR